MAYNTKTLGESLTTIGEPLMPALEYTSYLSCWQHLYPKEFAAGGAGGSAAVEKPSAPKPIDKPRAKRKPAGDSSTRRIAAMKLAQVLKVLAARLKQPDGVDVESAALGVAMALNSATEGKYVIKGRSRRPVFPGMTLDAIKTALRCVDMDCTDSTVTFAMENVSKNKTLTIASAIALTCAERDEHKAWNLGLCKDETRASRAEELRLKDVQKQAEARRAKGMKARRMSNAVVKPWEAFGMCRSTWYKRGKPMPSDTQPTKIIAENGVIQQNRKLKETIYWLKKRLKSKEETEAKLLNKNANLEKRAKGAQEAEATMREKLVKVSPKGEGRHLRLVRDDFEPDEPSVGRPKDGESA